MAVMIPASLAAVVAHVESTYPEEGCGLLFHRADGRLRAQPMTNIYDRYHQRLPAQFPRTNRTAYFINPLEFDQAVDDARARGEVLRGIFHSHADVGAYFSQEDQDLAAPQGLELHPGVLFLVVAVDQGRTTDAKVFRFQAGAFVDVGLETLVTAAT